MYDQWLIGAMENETLKGTTHLYENREQVLREAKSSKLESLAKGFMNVQGVEIEGNASHNKIVALQNEYLQLMNVIQAIEQKKIAEPKLYEIAVQVGQNENRPQEGEERQALKLRARFNDIFSQILSLSSGICATYIKSVAEKRAKQVSEVLGSNEAKADYALRNMRKITDTLAEAYDEKKKEYDVETDADKKKNLGDEMDQIYAQKAQVANMLYSLVK
jgi:hypothetical protein